MANENSRSKSMNAVFENIEKLTKVQRLLICGAIFLVFVGAFVYFSFLPKHKEIGKLKSQHEELKKKLEVAKKKAAQLNKFKALLKKAEKEFQIAKKALPEKGEIPSLIRGISQAGSDSGLDFFHFKPQKERKKGFYAEIPVSVRITGNYHNVALFFDMVAALNRIVNVRNIAMKPKGAKLDVTCTTVTYRFIEEKKKKKKKKK